MRDSLGRSESQMAELFLEINDNQRRVPSSLRWDLYRLVRTEDQSLVITSDIVFELADRKDSPFYAGGIDLTGEKPGGAIKQGSLAPEIRRIVTRYVLRKRLTFVDCVELLIRFFAAVQSLDPDGWGDSKSVFFRARVLRALLRVLVDLLDGETDLPSLTTMWFRGRLDRIKKDTLTEQHVKDAQGAVGVQNLYAEMRAQVFQD